MSPDEYCQQKTAHSGSSLYYSILFLPEERRRAITALYAFCREVDDVVNECRDVGVARTKLAWWREELERLFADSPQHPATRALAPAVERYGLAQEHFGEIIDGMQMDLDYDAYPSFTELSLYCYRVSGVSSLLAAKICGHEDGDTAHYANDLGLAFQLTNILRDVREDAARGHVYLPLDELKRFGVNPEALRKPVTTAAIRELLAFQAERARGYYHRAFQRLPNAERHAQRSGLIMAEIDLRLLDEIERDGYRVLEHRIRLTPLRKLWVAWRTARREQRRHRRKPAHAA